MSFFLDVATHSACHGRICREANPALIKILSTNRLWQRCEQVRGCNSMQDWASTRLRSFRVVNNHFSSICASELSVLFAIFINALNLRGCYGHRCFLTQYWLKEMLTLVYLFDLLSFRPRSLHFSSFFETQVQISVLVIVLMYGW